MKRREEADGPDPGLACTRGELARLCGVPERTLARWVEHGLLPRSGQGPGGDYGFRDLTRARVLARLCREGWTAPRLCRAIAVLREQVADLDALLAGLQPPGRTFAVRLPDGRLCTAGGQGLLDFESGQSTVHELRRTQDWFQIGIEAESEGRLADAVLAYERALQGGGTAAWFNLGNCRYRLQDLQGAAAAFSTAVELDPAFADAWNNLGVVQAALGERPAAMAAFRRVLELVPHYADAHYNLADLYAGAGDLEQAREHWRAYLRYDPNSRHAAAVRARLQE